MLKNKNLKQPNNVSCGQTCVAMLLDISINEATRRVGKTGILTETNILPVLEEAFPGVSDRSRLGPMKLKNKKEVYLCLHKDPKGPRGHWTVWNNGFLDPAKRSEEERWPVFKYWLIK